MASSRTTDRFLPVFIVWDIGPGAGDKWTEMMNEAVNRMVDEMTGMNSKVPVEFCFIGYGDKPHVKKKMSALTGRENVNFEAEGQSNLKPVLEQVAAFASDKTIVPAGAFAPVIVLLSSKASDVSAGDRNISDIAQDAAFKNARDALGPKAVRLAAGYGNAPDFDLLNAFIDDASMPAVSIDGEASLSKFMDWAAKLIRDKASSDNPDAVSPAKADSSFDKKCLMVRRADKEIVKPAPVNVEPAKPNPVPKGCLPIFVIVDVSYSMEDDMGTVNSAIRELMDVIRGLQGDVRLCIITFGSKVEVIKPLSPIGPGESYSLSPNGVTMMGRALEVLYEEMSKIPEGSCDPMAILLSDGYPTDYRDEDESVEAIRRNWMPMYTIINGEHSCKALRSSMAIGTGMDNHFLLAFNSKGTPVVQSTPESIKKFFKTIGQTIVTKTVSDNANDVKTIDFSKEFTGKELVFKRSHNLRET